MIKSDFCRTFNTQSMLVMKYLTKTACLLPLFIGLFLLSLKTTQAQNHFVESFETPSSSWSSYTTGTVTFPSGDWDFTSVFDESAGDSFDGSDACRINDDVSNANITTPSVDGVGTVSFYYHRPFSGSGTFELQKSVNGGSWTTLDNVNFNSVTSPTFYSYDVDDSSNNIRIRIVNDDNSAHLTIDLFTMGEAAPSNTNDTDTEIYETGSPVAGATITAANATTSGSAVDVFNFTIEDQGSGDGLSTNVTEIVVKPATNNTADWTDHIQGIVLDDGSNFITPASSPTITDTEITIPITSGDIEVADGSSVDVTIAVYLNTSNIVDGAVLAFEIPASGFDFTSDAAGSGFTNSLLLGAVTGNDFTIDVNATQLQFTTQPVNSSVSAVIAQVDVAYTDVNGNVDTDYDGSGFDIQLTSTGTFDGSATTTVQANNGVAAFDNLIFSATGTGLTLTATDQSGFGIGSVVSNTFDVSISPVEIVKQSFEGSGWSYTESPSAYSGSDVWDIATARNSLSPTDGSNFWFITDIVNGSGGTSGGVYSTLTFSSQNISGYSSVEISFDYGVNGWDSGDDMAYEVFEDGVSTGEVKFVDGSSNLTTSNTVTVSISGSASSCYIVLKAVQNGGDYGFFDNVILSGIPPTASTFTYNGSWSPSNPVTAPATSFDDIEVVSGTVTIADNLTGNNLSVSNGATLTISSNTFTIAGDITNNGTINVSNGASLLQTTTTDNNSGSGTYNVTRSTGTLSNDTWYQYWSSPVTGETMGDAFTGSNANDFYSFDGSWSSETSGTTMTPGVGYATTGTIGISGTSENRTFSGSVNNGNVTVNSSVSNAAYTLVGNPYPSALSASTFLTDNSGQIEGTLWFWDHHTNESGGDNDAGDYATWNGSGGAGNSGDAPTGNIGTAQGFFVQAATGTPTISFNNAQRISGNNDKFYKTSNTEQRKRAWLTLTNENNDVNQILVAFLPQATNGYDDFYDGKKFKAHPRLAFYSLINDEELAIQGLPWLSLNKSKEIPLGVDAWVTGDMTIALDSLGNWPNNYSISLEDRLMGTSVNLKDVSTYSFTIDSVGTIQNRFYLHVSNVVSEGGSIENPSEIGNEEGADNNNPTGTEELQANQLTIFRSGEELVVSSDLSQVDQITVFDVSGRVVFDKALTSNMVRIPWSAKGLFIVSVQTADGKQHTAKVNF